MITTLGAPLLSTIGTLSETEKEVLAAKLLDDVATARGNGPTLPLRNESGRIVGYFVPKLRPASKSTIPDFPPEYLVELRRRAATPEDSVTWEEFRSQMNLDDDQKRPQ